MDPEVPVLAVGGVSLDSLGAWWKAGARGFGLGSAVYAAGRYEDTFVKREGRWLYEKHIAVLDTRKIEPFTHLPL